MAKKNGKVGVFCAALIALLIAAMFCGCEKVEEDKSNASLNEISYTETAAELPVGTSDEPTSNPPVGLPEELPPVNVEPEHAEPVFYEVTLRLTYAASISTLTKGYTANDFPEVQIKMMIDGMIDATYAYQQAVKYGREDTFRRYIVFRATVNSREEVFEVLRLLNERDDVEIAYSLQLEAELALDKFEKLDPAIKSQVHQDLFDDYIKEHPNDNLPKEYLFDVYRYYGKHSGYYVMVNSLSPLTVCWEVTIDGITLGFGSPPAFPGYIFGWKDGFFEDIKVLYEQGLLTREDILKIADTYYKIEVAEREALDNLLQRIKG
jgi:hypothetical protein